MKATRRPAPVLLLRLAAVVLALGVLRWIFYLANRASFPALHPVDVLRVAMQGLRFDAMTVVVANLPLILLALPPLKALHTARAQRWSLALFLLVNGLVLFLCCIDLPFYGFNGKRITRDVLGQADAGLRGMPLFVVRYWWATAVFLLLLGTLVLAWRRIGIPRVEERSGWRRWPATLALAGGLLLVGRGGWQYQGLSPALAADHVPVPLAPLVTNSAFTFGYSIAMPTLQLRRYMDPDELGRRVPTAYRLQRDTTDERTNVVLLIVESLGREYVHAISGETAYMPFLDSLCAHSLVYTRAFANAERSNKSMCALLAGIPSFTDDAFMNTPYADDRVEGLGSRMREMGYSTAFFHGGLNGEYKFDSFSRACGFDRYYGKDEFAGDSAYDGHWGIYDEEFLQYVCDRLGALPQPFCAVEFTLSSHDPFPVPPRHKGRFPTGTQEIHESLGYVDMALRRFFQAAQEQPWFRNTLFVITGDHTFQYNDHPAWYRNAAGRFAVPILLFRGDGSLSGTDPRIAQHLDIVPTILDRTGYEGTISTMGQSLLRRDRPDRAMMYLGGLYRLVEEDRVLLFDGERTKGLFDPWTDTACVRDLSHTEPERLARMTRELEALIQRHGEAMVGNSLRSP